VLLTILDAHDNAITTVSEDKTSASGGGEATPPAGLNRPLD
jgi:hypothetical protein